MQTPIKISIIIVNYNTAEFIKQCLDSLKKHWISDMEIIIIDNNSTDRSIESLVSKFPGTHFYFLKDNKGFGAGCNYGTTKANGKYLLFLNPDITVTSDAISYLYNHMEKNPDTGVCSGLLYDKNEIPAYCFNNFPDLSWEFMQAFGIGLERTIRKLLNHPNIISGQNDPFEVDWFHGACLLIKKELFNKVNGFDENIFLYYEDVDICYKVKILGYKNICIPNAKFYHFTQSSVRGHKGQRVYFFNMHKYKNYYMKKYFPIYKRVIVHFFYILAGLLKIVVSPFRKKKRTNIRNELEYYLIIIKVHLGIMRDLK